MAQTGIVYLDRETTISTDSIVFWINVTVNYANPYFVRFYIKDLSTDIVEVEDGAELNYTAKETKHLRKTITGLSPSTGYEIEMALYVHPKGQGISEVPCPHTIFSFVTDDVPGPTPPSPWHWSERVTFNGKSHSCPITYDGDVPYVKISANEFKMFFMGATEWNEFENEVNALLEYHGLSRETFRRAVPDTTMSASLVNGVIRAINSINPRISVNEVQAGKAIGASTFIDLQNAFNDLRQL